MIALTGCSDVRHKVAESCKCAMSKFLFAELLFLKNFSNKERRLYSTKKKKEKRKKRRNIDILQKISSILNIDFWILIRTLKY